VSLKETATLVGAGTCVLPMVAALLRHRPGMGWVTSALAGASTAAFLLVLRRLTLLGGDPHSVPWVYVVAGAGVPVVLGAYLLTVFMGREDERGSFVASRRTFFALGLVGLVFLAALKQPTFLIGYLWESGTGTVFLGPLGKAYLTYLLVGIVFIGYNLESTLRLAGGQGKDLIRPAVLGLFGVLGFMTYALTTALLYGRMEVDTLIAAALPIALGNVLVAWGFLRGALVDAAVPVSRNVVYTSFTAFVAAVYVITVGVLAQLAQLTHWSPGEVVTVSLSVIVVTAAMVLLLSNRWQRRLRRFIDRNFYVNRYDYRAQWFRATRAVDPSQGPAGVLRGASSLLLDVFRADSVTFSLRDPATGMFVPRAGQGTGSSAVLDENGHLAAKLHKERRALLLDRNPEDFEYIGIYVEEREWLEVTASQIVAPLMVGQHTLGIVGLARNHPGDRFTFEDLDLLDNVSAQIAAVIRSVQLAEELADAREMELLSQWSSMILHDLKNYVSPLRLIVQNMRTHIGNEEFQRQATDDMGQVADKLETLVRRLTELREGHRVEESEVDLSRLVTRTAARLQLARRPDLRVRTELAATVSVKGDPELLQRVVENLITNAVDAMRGEGELTLRTTVEDDRGRRRAVIGVEDTGSGMEEEFVRNKLFRPFATTKRSGLGLGLYQCRSIVRAHHGDLRIDSHPGRGTRVLVLLPLEANTDATPSLRSPASMTPRSA